MICGRPKNVNADKLSFKITKTVKFITCPHDLMHMGVLSPSDSEEL